MPKPARIVAAALKKKGFRPAKSDHIYYHLYVDDKKTVVYTKISHSEKEIHDGLLGTMARQVKLNRKQFNDLVDCPLDHAGYVKILAAAGIIKPLADTGE